MKRIIKSKVALIALILTILVIFVGIAFHAPIIKAIKITRTDDPEMKAELTYPELKEKDKKVRGTDNILFSAFFLRDLDGDGYAEKLKGTCKNVTDTDMLYIDFNVLGEGRFENGLISLNLSNCEWKTVLIADNIVQDNRNGTVSYIRLKNELLGGSQKLFWGSISSKINNDISKYHGINQIILTGTYINENHERIPIKKVVELPVDWYGTTNTKVNKYKIIQRNNIETLIQDDLVNIEFVATVLETKAELILQKQEVEINIPELNGYQAINAYAKDSKYTSVFNRNQQTLKVTNSSTIDDKGKVTKTIARNNEYGLVIVYPLEAYLANEDSELSMDITVKGKNYGYNNNSGSLYFSNPYISSDSNVITVIYEVPTVEDETNTNTGGSQVIEPYIPKRVWSLNTRIGNYVYSSTLGSGSRISKDKIIDKYNGNTYEHVEDTYRVSWNVTIQDSKGMGTMTLEETKEESMPKYDQFYNSSSEYISTKDFETIKEVYFKNAYNILGPNGWIKIYDAETGILQDTLGMEKWGTVYFLNLKSIKIETSAPITEGTLTIEQIKELDSDKIVETFTLEEFQSIRYVYTYLTGTVNAMPGSTLINDETSDTKSVSNFASYEESVSIAKISVDPTTISNQLTENVDINVFTISTNDFEKKWVKGRLLVEFPKDIISVKINEVKTLAGSKPLDYSLIKYSDRYVLKIIMNNEAEEQYKLVINADLTGNPTKPSQNEEIVLYAYNENCDTYYQNVLDKYDTNFNYRTDDYVGYSSTVLTTTAPSELLTTEYITNFDDNDSVALAPNVAEIEKSSGVNTATINVVLSNNYVGTVSDIMLLGRIPYQENRYILVNKPLKSTYTAQINGPINVPEELQSIVTVYYSENGNASKDLTDSLNGWTTNVSDWTKIKSYLIDYGDHVFTDRNNSVFTYEVNIPDGLNYDSAAFSSHCVYYSLTTEAGKINLSTEPNRVGIQIVGKYNMQVTKNKLGNENTKVKGAMYRLVAWDVNGRELSQIETTDENGVARFSDIYIGREYTLEELISPKDYVLNTQKIKFTTSVDELGYMNVNTIRGAFKEQPEVVVDENNIALVKSKVEDETKYTLTLKKKDEDNQLLEGILFSFGSGNNLKTYSTDNTGKIVLKGLEVGKEYKLKEIKAKGFYVDDSYRTFTVKRVNGVLKVDSSNQELRDAIITYPDGVVQSQIEVNIVNTKIPTYKLQILKVNETNDGETEVPLAGACFRLDGEDDKEKIEYETDANGIIEVDGLYAYVEGKNAKGKYLLHETKAPEGYTNNIENISFKVTKKQDESLEVKIDNESLLTTVKEATIENNILKLKIQDRPLFKLTKIDNDTGLPLANVEFIIYRIRGVEIDYAKDSNGYYIGELNADGDYVVRTNEAGEIILPLPNGIYCAAEVKYPEGYKELGVKEYFKVGTIENEDQILPNDERNSEEEENVEEELEILEINYIEDLVDLSDSVNQGRDYTGKIVRLNRTLDFNNSEHYRDASSTDYGDINEDEILDTIKDELTNALGFKPIGLNAATPFRGIFDGQGYKIENIYENNELQYTGLFGYIDNGKVRNLEITGNIINADRETHRYNYTASISGYIGNNAIVENCCSNVRIECTGNAYSGCDLIVGGVVGISYGTIKNCYNLGALSAVTRASFSSNSDTVGGIVGRTNGLVVDCYNLGTILSNDTASSHASSICSAGGIAGSAGGEIKNCYNKGRIIGSDNPDIIGYGYAGGIAGRLNSMSTIVNCYNTASISASGESGPSTGSKAGGIVGQSSAKSYVGYCYDIGDVSAHSSRGAIIGECLGECNNCVYIDSFSSTFLGVQGYAETSSDMKSASMVKYLGENNWEKDTENVNNGYPILKSYSPITDEQKITEINYIEDLIELEKHINTGEDYSSNIIRLNRTLNFSDEDSYRDCYSTQYGDINRDGVVNGILRELTSGNGFTPIGISCAMPFKGVFDGQGYEIQNIKIIVPSSYAGLFGYIVDAEVKNLGITGSIKSDMGRLAELSVVGGIAGYAGTNTYITNCYNIASIYSKIDNNLDAYTRNYVGGIVGYTEGNVKNSYNIGTLEGYCRLTGKNSSYFGGITSYLTNTGAIENCYNEGYTGDISVGSKYLGGIAAVSDGTIVDCYNTSDFEFSCTIGGIVAKNTGTINKCYNTGNISVYEDENIGGIAGINEGIISNTYNTGNLYSEAYEYGDVGGIAGRSGINGVRNSYNIGNVELYRDSDYGDDYTEVGPIVPGSRDLFENCYYLDTINIYGNQYEEIEKDSVTDSYMRTKEFYGQLNKDVAWYYIEGEYPILLNSDLLSNFDSVAEITVTNEIKKFKITTDIKEIAGEKGGTISGEDADPYETVVYNENNTKEIRIVPDEGYVISKIEINGKPIEYVTDENRSYTIPTNYFTNMKEDKNIVVTFSSVDKSIKIKKVDKQGNPLEGAVFELENTDKPQIPEVTVNGVSLTVPDANQDMSSVLGEIERNGLTYNYINKNKEAEVTLGEMSNNGSIYREIDRTQELENVLGNVVDNGTAYKEIDTTKELTGVLGNIVDNGTVYNDIIPEEEITDVFGSIQNNGQSCFVIDKTAPQNDVIGPLSRNSTSSYYFTLDSNNHYIPNNKGKNSTVANSYFEIDLTGKTGKYAVVVNASISSESADIGYATITTSNSSVPAYSNANGRFIYISGTYTLTSDYESMELDGGNKYYLYLGYYKDSSVHTGNDLFTVNSINVYEKKTTSFYFENQDGIYVSNNTGLHNTVANSYMEIDLTNYSDEYLLVVNAEVSSASGDYGYATITSTTTAPAYNTSTGRFIYLSGTYSANNYTSKVLTGGNKYYLHFGYYKNASGSSGSDCFKVNSIKLYKSKSFSYNFETQNGVYISNNVGKDSTVANSYIPLDLSGYSGDCYVVVNAEVSSASGDIGYVTINSSTTAPSYSTSNGRFVYLGGETSQANDYTSSILTGGSTYNIHLGYYKNASGSSGDDCFKVNSIKVYEAKTVSYSFENQDGILVSNNIGKDDTVANAYIPLDLTNYDKNVYVEINAQVSSAYGDYGYATITSTTTAPAYNSSTGRLIYIYGSTSAKNYTSSAMQGGRMYYIHLGYYKNSSGADGEDCFKINSIHVYKEQEKTYYFENHDGVLVSNNAGISSSTTANSIIPIDLTNYDKNCYVVINGRVSSYSGNYGYATITSTTTAPAYNSTTGRFLYKSGTSGVDTDYTSSLLRGGEIYYLHLGYYRPYNYSYGDDCFYINSITVYEADSKILSFDEVDGKYVSNNQGIGSSTANSIIPIDLRELTGSYYVVVNANISSEYGDYGYATINTSTTAPTYNTSSGRFIYITGTYDNVKNPVDYKSAQLNGGQLYYLHLGYYKNLSGNGGDDCFTINSINVYPSKTIQLGFEENNGIYTPNNIGLFGTTAQSYIEIDLSEYDGEYDLKVDAESNTRNYDYGYMFIKEDTESPNYDDEEGRLFSIYGKVDSKIYETKLEGGKEYYLHMGYKKDSYVSAFEGESFIINSIKLSKTDRYTATTNEDGEAIIGVENFGEYIVKEIKAPDHYLKNDDERIVEISYGNPIQELEFENERAKEVVVHHYLKGTTTKVAEDDILEGAIGEEYEARPHVDLNKLQLYMDENTQYEDFKGVFEEEGKEFIFYYEPEKITLTIHHYKNGTEDPIIDDEIIETESVITFENELKYTVTTEGSYELKENSNYKNLINRLDFVAVASDTKDFITIDDTIEYTRDTVITYYYDTLEASYIVNYYYDDVKDDDATEYITDIYNSYDEYTDKCLPGYKLDRAKALDENGEEVDLPLIIKENSEYNVINVYYITRTDFEYTVHYKEQETEAEVASDKVMGGNSLGAVIQESAIDIDGYDKVEPTDAEFEITLDTNEVTFYYTKRTDLEYTVNYLEKETNEVLETAKTEGGQTYLSTIQASDEIIQIEGYNYNSLTPETLTISATNSENVINIYYTKKNDLEYTVNYLEKETNAVLKTAKTEGGQTYLDTKQASDEIIPITGYDYDSAAPETLTIQVNSESNVINLYYTKKNDLEYTVNYLEKGTNEVIETAKTEGGQTYLDTVTSSTEIMPIEGYNYDSLTPETLTISATNSENVINIYYTKKNDLEYTVNYLEKGTNEVLETAKTEGGQTYLDTKQASDEIILINGYNYDSADPETITIQVNSESNVINLYYTKKNDLEYTVNYLEKGTNEVLETAKTEGGQTYLSTIQAADEIILINGYDYDSADPETITIQVNSESNVINLYYTKKNDLEYTVNYLEKGTNEVLEIAKTEGGQTYLSTIQAADEIMPIEGYNYDSLTPEILTITSTNSENIINIYYTKKNDLRYTVKYLEKDNDTDDSNNTVLHEEKNIGSIIFGTTIVSSNEVIPINGYDFDSADKTSLTVGTIAADNIITLYYTKGTFGYEVHYFYDGVEDVNEKEEATATFEDVITYQDVIDNFGDKVRDGYALSGYTPVDANDELHLVITSNPNNNVININYRTEYTVEAEVKEVTETSKDGATTNVTGGNIYEGTNIPYSTENVFKGDDSEKSIIIVPNNGYEIVSIIVTDENGSTELDLNSFVNNDGTVTLNKDNGFFTNVNSDKKVEVEFRKQTTVIVKYLSATETDDNGDPLVLATEETITGYESKEFTTVRKPITYYQNSSKGITDENDTTITEYDRVSLDTNGNAEGTMYSDTLTIIYWYERIPAGIVVRHIEVTAEDINNGLTLNSGTEIESELLQGYVSQTATVSRKSYDKYISVDGPVSTDENLIIVSKTENSKNAVYKAIVDGEIVGLEFTEYDPADYVVEVRFYYIKQYTISTEIKPHDENGQEVNGGTISGQDDDVYEVVDKMGENVQTIVITPDDGYRVKTVTINDEQIDVSNMEADNHIITIPVSYIKNIDEDIVISVEFEKILAKVIVQYIDIDTNEVISEEIIEGNAGDNYTTERKDFESYVPAGEEPNNSSDVMTEADITVKYYYKKQFTITTDVVEHEEAKYVLIEIPKDGEQEIEIINVKGGTISGEDEIPYEIVNRGDDTTKAIVLKPEEHYKVVSVKVNGEDVEIINEKGYTLAKFENVQTNLHIEVKYERIPASLKVRYVDEDTGKNIEETHEQAGNSDTPYKTTPKEIDGYKMVRVDGKENGRLGDGETTVIYYYKKFEETAIIENGGESENRGEKENIEESENSIPETIGEAVQVAKENVKTIVYNAKTGDPIVPTLIGLVASMFTMAGIEVIKVVNRRKKKGEEENK